MRPLDSDCSGFTTEVPTYSLTASVYLAGQRNMLYSSSAFSVRRNLSLEGSGPAPSCGTAGLRTTMLIFSNGFSTTSLPLS